MQLNSFQRPILEVFFGLYPKTVVLTVWHMTSQTNFNSIPINPFGFAVREKFVTLQYGRLVNKEKLYIIYIYILGRHSVWRFFPDLFSKPSHVCLILIFFFSSPYILYIYIYTIFLIKKRGDSFFPVPREVGRRQVTHLPSIVLYHLFYFYLLLSLPIFLLFLVRVFFSFLFLVEISM